MHVPVALRRIVAALGAAIFLAPALPMPETTGLQARGDEVQVAGPKNPGDLRAVEDRMKQVVGRVLPSVVGVRVGAGQGSGVIVSEDGFVLTAGHVSGEPGKDVVIVFQDGKTAKGKTLGCYKSADAGLVKITDAGKWPAAEKGKSADLKPGAWCVAAGHPFGYTEGRPPVIRAGRILQVGDNALQSDCPLIAGDSGGPLFDLEGRVIGINSRIGGSTNMNFHVPIDVFTQHWERLVKGEKWERDLPSRDSESVKAAFRPVLADVGPCVVRVRCDGKDAALGTIVGPDGWIVTKASELKGKITCRFRDGKELEARRFGASEPFDLAMLKVQASGLPVIPWKQETDPPVGQWVAAAGMQDAPLAVGVISVPRRRIPPPRGKLGVIIEDGDGGPVIRKIVPKSPAEKVGLKPDDLILQVNNKTVKDRSELIDLVKDYRPGDTVELTVKRGSQKMELKVKLGKLDTPGSRKQELQNRSGTGVSDRKDDFPLVLQHDAALRPVDCGGPLVDLSGRALGINVARGGRIKTYAVPIDALTTLMYDMISGRLPVELTEAEKKAIAEKEAKAAAAKAAAEKAAKEAADKLAREKAEAEKKAAEAKAALDKALAEKKAAEEASALRKAEVEKLQKQLRDGQAARGSLENARKAAETRAAAAEAAVEKAQAEMKSAAEALAAAQSACKEAEAARKAAEERLAAEKAARHNAEAEMKSALEELAAEKAARQKAEAEKKALEQAVAKQKAPAAEPDGKKPQPARAPNEPDKAQSPSKPAPKPEQPAKAA